jgi:hypothetical protein
MESGWLVNSILSKSKDSAAAVPGRSYQISPIAPSSWRALLHGRKSKIPQGFARARARMFNRHNTSYFNRETVIRT